MKRHDSHIVVARRHHWRLSDKIGVPMVRESLKPWGLKHKTGARLINNIGS